MVSREEPDNKILDFLRRHRGKEFSTKEVAEKVDLSPSTTAKYLGFLEKDGKVAMRLQKPFKFWKIKLKKEMEG
jgi:response regulator of citrate/malate metabolism